MRLSRREFVRGGLSAFTVGVAAPAVFSELAHTASPASRNLVVLFLAGGNDALSMLVPYTDPYYYSRRPSIAVAAGSVLQVGSDSAGNALGLHPNLPGLRTIYDHGRLAIIQRAGYANSSRSHFTGTDIWESANPANPATTGWLGRYIDTLPEPVDALAGWAAVNETPRAFKSDRVSLPAIPSASAYTFASPNSGTEAALERSIAQRIASHAPADLPQLSFVNANITTAMTTIDRVAAVTKYTTTVTYPATGLGAALKSVAGAISRQIGTKVFWVSTGGFDTHAAQAGSNGAYPKLMATLNDSLAAFYTDLSRQGLLGDTLLVAFSEFGRRVPENGSTGCDHGAAGVMLALGGQVRGGLYGTAASLNPSPSNPTLENNGNDVHFETDFRSVYARVFESWFGADSIALLGGDFRASGPAFI
jgi:uncharacterized protein (DUF1501 family)